MKLIIDIPDETYEALVINQYCGSKSNLENIIVNGTPLKEWLKTFNTDSAPICFNKIQELKRECERDERTTKS